MTRFLVLGPVEVTARDVPVVLQRPRTRAVLGYLLLRANRMARMETLIEALWGGTPPETARAQVQADVSIIRRVFHRAGVADLISTRPGGYQIAVEPDALDMEAFASAMARSREAVGRGDRESAARLARSALRLWRGPAFADVEAPYAYAARLHLDEQRAAAHEFLADLELSSGLHHELVPELKELASAYPGRMTLRGQLMLALYRCGRQAEALTVAREFRTVLAEEHGLDPGPDIARLEAMILRRDPELDFKPAPMADHTPSAPTETGPAMFSVVPRQLPPDSRDFIGRADTVALLTRLLEADRVVHICGAGGVGKTVLAVRVAWQVRDRYPDGSLFADLRADSDTPASTVGVMAAFLRALGVPLATIPTDGEELVGLFRSVLSDRRVLVVLDNAATEGQVRALIPPGSGNGVLITSRRPLAGLAGTELVRLDRLAEPEAVELLEAVAGTDRVRREAEATRRLVALCGGLPLAVRIVGARLRTRQDWTVGYLADRLADERKRLDELQVGDLDARASIAASYNRLSPKARRALRLFSLLPPSGFGRAVGAAVVGCDGGESENAANELVEEHLLHNKASGTQTAPRYGFHDLVRLFGRELPQDHDGERAAALGRAHQTYLGLARAANEALPTARYPFEPAGGDSADVGSPEAAVSWFEVESAALMECVTEAIRLDQPATAARIVAAMTNFLLLQSRFTEWDTLVQRVLDALTGLPEHDRGVAAMLHSRGLLRLETGRNLQAWADFRRARLLHRKAGSEVAAATAATEIGICARQRGQVRVARTAFDQAIAFFDKFGATRQAGHAYVGLGNLLYDFGQDPSSPLEPVQLACDVFRATGERNGLANALSVLGQVMGRIGRFEEATALLREAIDLYGHRSDQVQRAIAQQLLANILLSAGQSAAARDQLELAMPILAEAGHRWARARALRTLGRLHLAENHPASARVVLLEAVQEFESLGQPVGAGTSMLIMAKAELALGDRENAVATARRAFTVLTDNRSGHAAQAKHWLEELGESVAHAW